MVSLLDRKAEPDNFLDKIAALEIRLGRMERYLITSSGSTSSTGDTIPSGVILLWSGAEADIPSGWHLCDGENETPNLRNRFIVGAGDTYAVDDTGGEASHALAEGELPSHTHTLSSESDHTHTLSSESDHSHTLSSESDHNHSISSESAHAHTISSDGAHVHSAEYYTGSGSTGALERHNGTTSWLSGVISSSGAHTHGGATGNGGGHNHGAATGNDGGHDHGGATGNDGGHNHGGATGNDGAHNHGGATGATGSGTAHENRPPYYALCYIMKA